MPSATHARRDIDRDGGRSGVAEIQRARMIGALTEVARERGAGGVTVAHVVARSGVSRRTFYELFEDRDDCFLAAFDVAVERAAQRVLPAYNAGGAWRERIRAGLGALLEFVEDEPGLGALCIVDALAAGPRVSERRTRLVGRLIDAVDGGRGEAKGGAAPTRLTAEGVVGGVLGVLHARLAAGAGMAGLHGPLMGMIVLPYQGQAAASKEVSRPSLRRRPVVRVHGDPLRELDMRLTYRTVRVLLAIADLGARGSVGGGPNNRQVADASGVQDQGQISKLLARLEHLGLIRNDSAGPAKGEPNLWSLTLRGQEIEHTIRRQTTPTPG